MLGALASVLSSWLVTGILVYEAIQRIIEPVAVNGKGTVHHPHTSPIHSNSVLEGTESVRLPPPRCQWQGYYLDQRCGSINACDGNLKFGLPHGRKCMSLQPIPALQTHKAKGCKSFRLEKQQTSDGAMLAASDRLEQRSQKRNHITP